MVGQPYPINIVPPPYGTLHDANFYAMFRAGSNRRIKPDSITGGQNHGGTAGLEINVGYDDARADLTAYLDAGGYSLPPPQTQTTVSTGLGAGNSILTNVHAGVDPGTQSGDCLEAGSAFYNTYNDPTTHSIFWVGDFCNTGGQSEGIPIQTVIDNNFQASYVRDFGDGLPRMTVELYQPIGGDGSWHAILYNYGTNQWDDIYHNYGNLESAGIYSAIGGNSWSLDETHYLDFSPCPQMPTASGQDIQVNVEPGGGDANNYFRLLNSGDYIIYNGGDCFHDDGSGSGAFYTFSPYTDQYGGSAWKVTDPAPRPTPPCANPINTATNICPRLKRDGHTPNLVCC